MEESILTSVVLPAALALIMLGMGLSLKIADFTKIFVNPKAVIIGLFNQMVLLPIIAYGLIELFGMEAGLAVGIMIIAACPGGTTSNLITHISKGDTALSVSLTALSTIITVFTIPILVNLSIEHYVGFETEVNLPIMQTLGALVLITLFPVAIGMLINHLYPLFAAKADKPVRIFSIIIFVVLVVGIILKNKEHVFDYFKEAGLVALTLNVLTMVLGFGISRLFKLNKAQSITVAIESGIQNGTLALLITLTLIEGASKELINEMSIAPAVYSLIMFFTGGVVMGYFGTKKSKAHE